MLRLMVLSDRAWGTSGYSKVTWWTCQILRRRGHSVAHVPLGRALRGGKFNYQGVLVYPSGNDPWCEDVALRHYEDFKADALITIKDVWVFNHLYRYAVHWVPMCPVDHSPVSPMITSRLRHAFKVVAISRFGQRELKKAGIEAHYIPHGVDTKLYRPLDKAKCKQLFYMNPDDFVVGVVARNQARKMIPRMLRGFRRFLELNPDAKAKMMLWTNIRPLTPPESTPIGVADVGVNLLPEIIELGLNEVVLWPEERIIDEGLPEWAGEGGWDMVKLYNSFDVLLHCTGGEGFGLPLIEAQSCGVPVVATDYSAMPELVGAGLTVPAPDYVIINTPGTRYALADIDKMAEALAKIYSADREKLARRARRFAERYNWELIAERYWKPFLEEVEAELKPLVTKEGVKAW